MIAAMMTAANLGARVTGWGFVVFTIGSVCWSIVGLSSGQTNLLATNIFLTVVNLVGIWRWLGRQRAYEDGAKSAQEASRRCAAPNLFTAGGIPGMAVEDASGNTIGKAVEALIECRTGTLSYVVVASGGVGGVAEELRAVPHDAISIGHDRIVLQLPAPAFAALPPLATGDWPAAAPSVKDAAA
ncbi:PRC-barrel domain-containing protein [Sphingomonas qilianensis]|uniref:PRC-barrel domain-containing protein n=1 Tax=Sphingomonas qilianensis TaxID=1736690 RepID=A0ABU9XS04_9SPHN